MTDGLNLGVAMISNSDKGSNKTQATEKKQSRSISEKMAVAEQLRDLQKALAPLRAANKAKRATGPVEILIKTR